MFGYEILLANTLKSKSGRKKCLIAQSTISIPFPLVLALFCDSYKLFISSNSFELLILLEYTKVLLYLGSLELCIISKQCSN